MRQDKDEELLYMVTFLEECFSFSDFRSHIKKTFCLQQLMDKHCSVVV